MIYGVLTTRVLIRIFSSVSSPISTFLVVLVGRLGVFSSHVDVYLLCSANQRGDLR